MQALVHRILLGLAALSFGAAAAAQGVAQGAGDKGVTAAPAAAPEGGPKLPDLSGLRLEVPRPVRAATAALGLGRARLALLVGVGTVGRQPVVDAVPRDLQALAQALGAGGFVVMRREDADAAEIRAALREFRARLQPDTIGVIYLAGLGVQVDGRNLLLARDAVLDASSPAGELGKTLASRGSVPFGEAVEALLGDAQSARYLVADAAYHHPALARLPQAGLAEQRLPPGLMALFSTSTGAVIHVPAVAPLPVPVPTNARDIAASRFAAAFVESIARPRTSGAAALRQTRKAMIDASLGEDSPWIGGDSDDKEELAELSILDAVVPRTPEEAAREGFKQVARQITRPAAVRSAATAVAADGATRADAGPGREVATDAPPGERAPGTHASATTNAGNAAGGTTGALGNAAGVLGTAATVVAAATGVAAAAGALQGSTAMQAGAAVTGAAGSAVGQMVALAARPGSAGTSESARSAATASGSAALPASRPAVPAPVPATAAAATAAASIGAGEAAQAATAVAVAPPAAAPLAALVAQALPSSNDAPRPSGPSGRPPTDGRTARAGEQGERPLYRPRTNPFGYAEGDTFTYQTLDTWKGEVTGTLTLAIEEVLDGGQMLANGQQVQLDAQGRLKSIRRADGSQSQFEPQESFWWSNPKVGERRDLEFIERFRRADGVRGEIEWSGSTRVGRPQKIELPAGEFEVLPLESSGWATERLPGLARTQSKWSRTVWYSPKLGHPVAVDIEDTERMGKLLSRQRIELLHAQTARTPAP